MGAEVTFSYYIMYFIIFKIYKRHEFLYTKNKSWRENYLVFLNIFFVFCFCFLDLLLDPFISILFQFSHVYIFPYSFSVTSSLILLQRIFSIYFQLFQISRGLFYCPIYSLYWGIFHGCMKKKKVCLLLGIMSALHRSIRFCWLTVLSESSKYLLGFFV